VKFWRLGCLAMALALVASHTPTVVPKAAAVGATRELPQRPIGYQNRNAVEVLRVWADPNGPNQFVVNPLWSDSGSWGVLLVDVARHAANAHAQKYGGTPQEALARIGQLFVAEWQRPTSEAEQVRK